MSARPARVRVAAMACSAARMLAWRAHAYGAPGELRLEEARVPPLRAPDHLLLRVVSASTNPIDVAMIGGYGRVALNTLRAVEGAACGGGDVEFPLVVGRDLVGEVVSVGSEVRGLQRGRRVWAVLPPHWPGAHQQYAVTRAAWCAPAPEALTDHEAGGALYAGLTACAACRTAGLRAGERARVLVLGGGGVGQLAVQLLAAEGAQVTVSCAPELAEWALDAGAEEVLDRHADDYSERLQRAGRWDVVLDCAGLGGEAAAAGRWQCGRYVTLTTPLLREMDARGAVAGAATAAWQLARQNVAARRAGCSSVRWAYFTPLAADIERLGALAAGGRLRPRVEATFPWRAAPRAYERQAQGHARGKLIIDFADDSPPTTAAAAAPC